MRRAIKYVTVSCSSVSAIALVAIAVFAGFGLASSPIFAGANLPVCVSGDNDVECDFLTFRQCQATAQNTGQSCIGNPGVVTYASAAGGQFSGAARNSQASAGSDAIRQNCIAQAQARYPDSGLGTVTVLTQRTEVYADCARSNGINP
ncbi:DUF3551 domain-containing protein [Tardiphaga sp. 841_E9_N1_2]|jgi:hypothetical protein|uniref:DUF3551 domain-containing protein n=1 Tax=Tardiphaga sp. 841_E9_N1_2 TaxID=3240762 RepID=UPI003F1F73DA